MILCLKNDESCLLHKSLFLHNLYSSCSYQHIYFCSVVPLQQLWVSMYNIFFFHNTCHFSQRHISAFISFQLASFALIFYCAQFPLKKFHYFTRVSPPHSRHHLLSSWAYNKYIEIYASTFFYYSISI